MMKVLKAKMFIIIKSLTCHYLVTTALAKQYLERPVTERISLLFLEDSVGLDTEFNIKALFRRRSAGSHKYLIRTLNAKGREARQTGLLIHDRPPRRSCVRRSVRRSAHDWRQENTLQ